MNQCEHFFEVIKTNLSNLLPLLHGRISIEYESELTQYLSCGEYGLVFEDLCEMISLLKIPIPQENFDVIEKLGKLMEYENPLWEELEEFITKQPN